MKIQRELPIWNGEQMLFKMMLRDLRKHKTQFISIFLMAFLGVFVFSGVGAEALGLEVNVNQFYEDTNMADGWIYSPYLNDLFLEQVDYLGATTQMERQAIVESVAGFENKPDVTLHFVENNTISKFYLAEGEPLDINDSSGVWLDKSFADAKGLKVGDVITFKFDDYEIKKEIKGVGYSPEYVYHTSVFSVKPDFNKMGFAYMSYKAFPSETVPYNVLNVKFDGTPESFEGILAYRLEGYYGSFVERVNHPSVNQFSEQITLHKMMTDIFPIAFILTSMLILLTTMTRIIAHQRPQIGILKANGFKNRSIIWHYSLYGFILVSLGSILGLILGPMIVPKLIYAVMKSMFILPSWEPGSVVNFIPMAGLMIILSLGVSLYSAESISNEKPSESIRPKKPKSSANSFIERFKFWQKLPFNVRWNYRDAKRNKFRTLMTIIGVIGCTVLLVSAFGMYDTMNDITEWEFNRINHSDSNFIIDGDASQSAIDEIVKEVDGDKIMDGTIEIESSSDKKSGLLLVLDGTDLITPTDENWNEIEIKDDEVSISRKMAELLDVKVGDTVKWHIMYSNKWVKTKIDKIHTDPNSQGLIMSKEKLEDLGLNFTPTQIITDKHIDKNFSAVKSHSTKEFRVESWNGIAQAAYLLIYTLILFASLLAIVVLYNLELLSFTEIKREIVTLKVLGFKSHDLRNLLLIQNLWFTAIGFIVGLPIGDYVLKLMWAATGDSFDVVPSISILNIIFIFIITFFISIIVNLMFSRNIDKIDIVESIKD